MHAEGLARNVWQLAPSYAHYLSPPFHLWCNTVVRTAIEQSANLPTADYDPLVWQFERQFRDLHRRLDTLDRHAADLMLLAPSGQDVLLGERRKFSIMNRILLIRVVAAESYGGSDACGDGDAELKEDGTIVSGICSHERSKSSPPLKGKVRRNLTPTNSVSIKATKAEHSTP